MAATKESFKPHGGAGTWRMGEVDEDVFFNGGERALVKSPNGQRHMFGRKKILLRKKGDSFDDTADGS